MKRVSLIKTMGFLIPLVATTLSNTADSQEIELKKGSNLNIKVKGEIYPCEIMSIEYKNINGKNFPLIDCDFPSGNDPRIEGVTVREKYIAINRGGIASITLATMCNAGKCENNETLGIISRHINEFPVFNDYSREAFHKIYKEFELGGKDNLETFRNIFNHLRANTIAHETFHARSQNKMPLYKEELGAYLYSLINSPSYSVFADLYEQKQAPDDEVRKTVYIEVGKTIFKEFEKKGYSKEKILDLPLAEISKVGKEIFDEYF